MVPTVLFGYFVLLIATVLVATGTVAWYWGVAMVAGFIVLERILFRESHVTDGDDALDLQHDAHLPHPGDLPGSHPHQDEPPERRDAHAHGDIH